MKKEEICKRLEELNNIGKPIIGEIKGTEEQEIKGIIIDEVSHMVNNENKYVIQQISFGEGEIGYRIGYYTYDANYKKLYYGGKCPIMNEPNFTILINEAKKKGWL